MTMVSTMVRTLAVALTMDIDMHMAMAMAVAMVIAMDRKQRDDGGLGRTSAKYGKVVKKLTNTRAIWRAAHTFVHAGHASVVCSSVHEPCAAYSTSNRRATCPYSKKLEGILTSKLHIIMNTVESVPVKHVQCAQ